MSNRVVKPILSARVIALVSAMFGTCLVACQSAPVTSKEPASREATSGSQNGAAVQNTALQNQAAAQTPQGSAPAAAPPEPAAVKLTGSNAPASAQPAAPAHAVPSAPQADKAGDKGAADKGTADKAADAKALAGKTVQGNVVNEEPFSTWLQVTSPAKAGAPVQLEAVLVAKPPYHCNAEYPHKFKLSAAPAGLAYPEETVRGMKVSPERSVLTIPVNAQGAGKPTVAGTLSFSVCTEERCLVEKRELSVALDVM